MVSLVRLIEFLRVSQLGYDFSARRALAARKPQEYVVGVPITAVIGTPLYGRNTL